MSHLQEQWVGEISNLCNVLAADTSISLACAVVIIRYHSPLAPLNSLRWRWNKIGKLTSYRGTHGFTLSDKPMYGEISGDLVISLTSWCHLQLGLVRCDLQLSGNQPAKQPTRYGYIMLLSSYSMLFLCYSCFSTWVMNPTMSTEPVGTSGSATGAQEEPETKGQLWDLTRPLEGAGTRRGDMLIAAVSFGHRHRHILRWWFSSM